MDNTVFEEIKVEKVSDKISDQIIKLIADGKLKPGDKLPGERQLIETLGVGRSSLREALNRLETLGYIEIHKRRGNFVKSIDAALQLSPLKSLIRRDVRQIVQLYEIRRDIEQANAYKAAQNRTAQDLTRIRSCLDQFRGRTGNLQYPWGSDQAFHIAVAQAAHNFMRVHVITNIFEFSEEFLKPALESASSYEENLASIVEQHEAIYAAIQNRDADEARARMDEHLSWTNETLTRLLSVLSAQKTSSSPGHPSR